MELKDVRLIILFGSRARETAGAASDIDIGILMHAARQPLTVDQKMELKIRIAEKFSFHEDHIDLVDLSVASPLLQYRAAEEGKLLFGMPYDFLRFKVLAWKRYLDTAKLRRMREEKLRRHYA